MRNPHACVHALLQLHEYRQTELSVTWTQCSLAFLMCAIYTTCIVPRGFLIEAFLKKKSVSWDSFVSGKSVKEEIKSAMQKGMI